MTSQQKQFADEYLIDLNGTKAAIRAGYDPNSARSYASQLLSNEDIAAYISKKQQAISDKLNWTYERLVQSFGDVHSRCMQGEPVLDFEGNPTGEWKFEPAAALKALENIGKHVGFYAADNKQKKTSIALINVDPLADAPTDNSTKEDSNA